MMSPILSMFEGIIVRMYPEVGGQHNLPHIHATYSGQEVVISLDDGRIIEGSLPRNKMKLLEAWIILHEEDLYANWETLNKDGEYFKINPLGR